MYNELLSIGYFVFLYESVTRLFGLLIISVIVNVFLKVVFLLAVSRNWHTL